MKDTLKVIIFLIAFLVIYFLVLLMNAWFIKQVV